MPITNECFQAWSSRTILQPDLVEADYRNIVSRSYYSAYHATLHYAETQLSIPVRNYGGSTHLKLAELLMTYKCDDGETEGSVRRLGSRISALHSLRIRADYFLDETILPGEAKSIIKNTGEILGIINNATPANPKKPLPV
ncbi:hypothetical protein [Pseudomonas viridiflava]|uniref:hypothetical protein n=1 Tax=Pseudomonas viridiflava TaxID=33069 RepID=UPI0013CEBA30|nr:hypothetical protein [Pseudomonas viridiflava]